MILLLGRLADRLSGFRRMLLEPEGPSDEAERISNERLVGQVVLTVGLAIAELV